MTNKKKVPVADLKIGMYVSELDRPWTDTPFMFQGIRISDPNDIQALRKHCKFVIVDEDKQQSKPPLAKELEKRKVTTRTREKLPPSKKFKYRDSVVLEKEISFARESRKQLETEIATVMESAKANRAINIRDLNKSAHSMVESVTRNPDAYFWLLRLKGTDDYTYRHSLDTAVLATAFGRHMGFKKEDLAHLSLGCTLFDIGKMRLPPQLLKKPGRLSAKEYTLVKKHVNHGIKILENTKGIPKIIMEIVAYHHERHNGSGYPHGLVGLKIPIFARMASIVDCYTAITTQRPFQAAISSQEAVREIYKWRDTEFQGALLEQFIQCLGVYPTGTIVELNTGQVGIVFAQNRSRRLRPRVMLILDEKKIAYESYPIVDLLSETEDEHGRPIEISAALESGAYGIDPASLSI